MATAAPNLTLPWAELSPGERRERGRAGRKSAPRSSHGEWQRPAGVDPVAILEAQETTRLQELVPLRHRRMLDSAFTFYRGAAAIMAADLNGTPDAGLRTQLCGDAHLSNFGGFAAADRRIVLDCNDFDETLPGPWEWDVKRLAASFEIAGRDRGFGRRERQDAVVTAASSYATTMAELAELGHIDVRYRRFEAEGPLEEYRRSVDSRRRKAIDRNTAKAASKTRMRALAKLTERVDGKLRIRSQPPVLVPTREIAPDEADLVQQLVNDVLGSYLESLSDENRHLLRKYRFVDAGRKVVGVGSVGTRAWIALLIGRDDSDPLFLQIKEAEASVLEPYTAPSVYAHHGRRVVEGQRLMQAAGDILLGWTSATIPSEAERHFYVRQLWDAKGSAQIEAMAPADLATFGRVCGTALASAHARAGDPIAIAGYLGSGKGFSKAMVSFAAAYADRNESDFAAFMQAIEDGRLELAPPEPD